VGVGPTATRGRWPSSVSGRPEHPGTRAEMEAGLVLGAGCAVAIWPDETRDELLRGAALAPAYRVPGTGLTAAPGRHIPGIVPVELLLARTDTHSVLLTQGPVRSC
jgi:hypothetical protein